MLTIRRETNDDLAAIRRVNELAFGQPDEARLVAALRDAGALALSLVAVEDGEAVGHIAFSPITIESTTAKLPALALAPLAVLPAHQRRGIGSELVRRGLDECRRAGHGPVIVLGEPRFYSRFGFVPCGPHGIRCPFEAPAEAFAVAELRAGALAGVAGTVRYHAAFDELTTLEGNNK